MGGEAIDEPLLFREHRLLARVGRFAVRLADRALALVEIVVAGVRRDLAAVDLGDARDDAVHEIAVVGGHQQRARPRLQERFEPDDRLDVEVVGGLVHQQHVGPADQHPRHRHAHLPPAGERADVAVDLIVVEAQAVQDLARPAFQGVAPKMLVLVLHLAEPGQDAVRIAGAGRVRHRLLQVLELVVQRAQPSAAGDRLVEHGPPRHFLDVLPEVADREAPRHRHLAVVGLLFADQHAEDGRLAGPVRSDEPDLVARVQLERGVDEQDLTAVLLGEVGEGNQR